MATSLTASLEGADELLKQLRQMGVDLAKAPDVRVGVPSEGAYPDGTPIETVGLVQEFGSEVNNIPARSYLRSTVSDNKKAYTDMLFKGLDSVVQGKTDVTTMLNYVGLQVEGDVKQKITDLDTPANKEATIKAKGSSNPLVDTGLLQSSIIYELTTGDE